MSENWSIRILRGKNAKGHVRVTGENMQLCLRSLPQGECALYAPENGAFRRICCFRADGEGNYSAFLPAAGKIFVSQKDRVLLWEEESDPDQNYWQAAGYLQSQKESFSPKPERPAVLPEPEAAARLTEEAPREPISKEDQADESDFTLRPHSSREPVDVLPTLIWPREVAHLKPYFEMHPPFAPFDAPGWRFIRLPSPLRGVPFCAVGFRAGNGRVTQVAYAVPGSSLCAPAALPGYRYQTGLGGQGYWTLWKKTGMDITE